MTDAQEEIKASLSVVSPEGQAKKREDNAIKEPLLKKESNPPKHREEKDIPLLGRYVFLF